jgi:hypothetical protein
MIDTRGPPHRPPERWIVDTGTRIRLLVKLKLTECAGREAVPGFFMFAVSIALLLRHRRLDRKGGLIAARGSALGGQSATSWPGRLLFSCN